MSETFDMSTDEDNVNILQDKNIYIHQYLTAVFQINLGNDSSNRSEQNSGDKATVACLNLPEADEKLFSFSNYSRFVFENLMNQNLETTPQYIDKRFLPERNNLFSSSYRVFEDDSNRIAYLFNCYCRIEDCVKDFANLISTKDRKNLNRYVIDQVALILACPYVNVRYAESTTITPFSDLFKVLTLNTWLPKYLTYVKKFFVEVTDAIYNAKNGITLENDDEYVSSLLDLSSDELNIEQIVQPIYKQLCQKFRESHQLTDSFIDDIKFINILIASPKLAEIFIDLNSPPKSRSNGGGGGGGGGSQANNETNSADNSSSNNNTNDIFRSFLLNTISTFDQNAMSHISGSSSNTSANQEKFFHNSLLGILLSNSPLPSTFSKPKENNPINLLLSVFHSADYEYTFFQSPTTKTQNEIEQIELSIDDQLSKLRSALTELFYSLLKSSPTVRTKTLKWIERCLATFNNRSKLWANELFALVGGSSPSNTSDGLVLNFSAVLLNLCKPFCSTPDIYSTDSTLNINPKMLKVDPIYMRYARTKSLLANPETQYRPYLEILHQESVLINQDGANRNADSANTSTETNSPPDSSLDKLTDYQPNFITHCFFATHKALHLGFRVIHERFTGINQENSQIQRRLDSLGLSNLSHYMNRDSLTPSQQDALQRLDQNMTITLSMKSALVETNYINLLLEFYLATAAWINNLAVCESEEEATQSFKKLELSGQNYFKSKASKCLGWIPEFIIENIIDFMLFLRYFEVKPKVLTLKSDLEPFLAMVILFMGSPNRMRNPHLRAKMAEMLEALLPTVQLNIQSPSLETLFKKSYFVEELFPALLDVFVSIEISDETNNGDVVAFEQKFNYRRPMYVVFKYLCTISEHQNRLIELATYAEVNMDSVQSPIFLRFINLLINDAIFLLDEGLSLMAKLREAQQERDSGAWARESSQQRQQNEANFVHLGRLAKFHNFIGRDTIATLTTITDYVKSCFSHKILVDRMASMLNYFLHHLVGPNKRNFKVKQMNEYEFNPGELVKNICRIYVNLACPNPVAIQSSTVPNTVNSKYEKFCLAICQDDRSYSPDLLVQADEILSQKLGQPMLGQDILLVDRTVKEVMRRQRHREIPLDDIPEDFLDPLMSTLMSDPVILPSSRKVLDRATITRHLLSDHTDPYTRTPLTMDLLVADVGLKKKIEDFISQKHKEMDDKEAKKLEQEKQEQQQQEQQQ